MSNAENAPADDALPSGTSSPGSEASRVLERSGEGDPRAAEQLASLLYNELRAIAGRQISAERVGHTLQPTALVHEAYLRLIGTDDVAFDTRAHFLGSAARAIRRVLVDHARARERDKRGGGRTRVEFHDDLQDTVADEDIVQLDGLLTDLATFSPVGAQVVELRFFAGMTIPETAQVLGASPSTVEREWRVARAWLHDRLEGPRGS